MTQLGYAVVFISHGKEKTIKPQYGEEYQQICPSLQSSAEIILENMSDIIGYAHNIVVDGVSKRVLTLRSNDDSIVCKSRFSNIKPEIDFSYESLSEALRQAIENEAVETNGTFVTNEKMDFSARNKTYDFEGMKAHFNASVNTLMERNQSNGIKIKAIVNKYLPGKYVEDCTPAQSEQLEQINIEIDDLLNA